LARRLLKGAEGVRVSIRPDFTPDQVRELKSLDVCDEQIGELRKALLEVQRIMHKPAALNDVRVLLNQVAGLSFDLIGTLGSIAVPPDAAHSAALGLIEVGYWQGERVNDRGPTSMHHLIPRLSALNKAALAGLEELPKSPARHRTADPRPIERIAVALSFGWSKAQGSIVESMDAKPKASKHRLPKKFRPSRSPGCAFLRIAGICYAAVGGEVEPDAAIRRHLLAEKVERKNLIEGIERAIKSAKPRQKKIG
jgi:hypothetical protein